MQRRQLLTVAAGGALLTALWPLPARAGSLPEYVPAAQVAGTLRCGGADTMQQLIDAWAQGFARYQPHAHIQSRHDLHLSTAGFAELLRAHIDLVSFVREPFAAETAAFSAKFGYAPTLLAIAGGSYSTKSGTHAIAVFVNAANPLTRMDLVQLDAIYSAERRRGGAAIRTWGQLGLLGEWAQRPLHVYGMLHRRASGNPPGIVNFLQQRVLRGGEFRNDIREQIDHPGETALDAIVHRVSQDPAGIGYSGFAYAERGTKTLALAEAGDGPFYSGTPAEVARRAYPLSRQIYLGFNAAPARPAPALLREFLSFVLSRQGQQAIAADRMHFIPLSIDEAARSRATLDRLS
ncbi:MAG: PstS family phosphate ABC transporter substrate-binding protein [Rudaea sp.]